MSEVKINTNGKDKVIRPHDMLYLNEKRKLNPKEYFKFTEKIAKPYIDAQIKKHKNLSIIDIGCATGDFLYYLSSLYKGLEYTGMDNLQALLNAAKREVLEVKNWIRGDIYTGKGLPHKKFDIVFMLGVAQIFDKAEPWIDNISKILSPSGRSYIFGFFNPEDVDMIMRTRHVKDGEVWQSGWNMISQKTVRSYLEKKKMSAKFHKFTIGVDIKKDKNDPLRSWTFKLENGDRTIINGTQILHQFYLLEIKRQTV